MSEKTKNKKTCLLSETYGSKRGLLFAHWFKLRYQIGGFRRYRKIDWQAVDRLIFVCKGNICRSAFAEAVARSLKVKAISCGIDTRPGFAANDSAIRAAAEKGIDLGNHATTTIQSLSISKNDLLIAMEPWHIDYLRKNIGDNCTLLGLWGCPESPYIQDPYGLSDEYFNNCFDYIEKSVHEVASKISKANES